MPLPIIQVEHLSKTFRTGVFRRRAVQALQDVSLTVNPGEIFGLLGPNGAGKTTLMNILMGLLVPDRGAVRILGEKITPRMPFGIKLRMNMCSGNPNFPWCLSVRETMDFYGLLYGLPWKVFAPRRDELLQAVELWDNRHTRYDELSTGNKQRLALAKSLINNPELVLLDEPTVGLDPDISAKIRHRILDLHSRLGKTIVLTTHYMKEAEEMCDRIAFIRGGRIIALGTKEELQALTKTRDLEEAFLELAHS
ncbi:MAG: ABC transporter ATP-binding protein [candidate division FCPU426 bacterium]